HLRAYTGADYVRRWAAYFCGGQGDEAAPAAEPSPAAAVLAAMAEAGVSGRSLAAEVGVDHSFLAKVLTGRKPPPAGLLERARAHLATRAADSRPARKRPDGRVESTLDVALDCLGRGWSVVPQLPGAKRPCVKWKHFQDVRPTAAEVRDWF